MTRIRSAGSATLDGADQNAAVKRLPPIGSLGSRTETGIEMGTSSMSVAIPKW